MDNNGNNENAEENEEFNNKEIQNNKNLIDLDEEAKTKKITKVGNKIYDEETLNRLTIIRLTQVEIPPIEIKNMFKVSKSLVYKWANYDKIEPKKMGRPPKFSEEQKEYIYQMSDGKMTIIHNASSRKIANQFENKFNQTISKTYINNLLYKRFGSPYRGINSILLTDDHISQRLEFSKQIIENNIKSSDILFTDECRIVLFPKVNPKINVIRFNENDKKNIYTYEVNKKRNFFTPKFEVSIMVAGGICRYGLSNLVFCSGTMNNFAYKQFLLFIKEDMDKIKSKFNLEKDLLFQQDNVSCHKSKESLAAIEVIFKDNKIWWPANSPDLSPIETVWSILKQELTKRNIKNLNELKENVIDIWHRFPTELCEKIISEFDTKIKICLEEKGKILNKAMIKKKIGSKEKKIPLNWEKIKTEKCFRIVYNDKIIRIIQKKLLQKIKKIYKLKIKEFKQQTIQKLNSKMMFIKE